LAKAGVTAEKSLRFVKNILTGRGLSRGSTEGRSFAAQAVSHRLGCHASEEFPRMPVRDILYPSCSPVSRSLATTLLASVSALALLIYAAPADARCIGACAGSATGAVGTAMSSAITSVQQAAVATQQSMQSLTRATLAVQAMQAAQSAAHNLALSASNSVPNGLVNGGLVPDSGLATRGVANSVTTWTGLNAPTQTTSGGETIVAIQQTAPKAIANWTTFNIGSNTEVYFNQSAGNSSSGNNWVVLNRILDPSGRPSQILGQIKAEGSVYVINQNGIIFGGGSQVNVSSFPTGRTPRGHSRFA
jgi:filamentous hemagglutinin family protein